MSAAAPQAPATEPHTVTIPPDQVAQLETALTLCKALAAPGRLAILGVLAAPPFPTLSMAELAQRCALPAAALERDLRQLAEARLIKILEWEAAQPGHPLELLDLGRDASLERPVPLGELGRLGSDRVVIALDADERADA